MSLECKCANCMGRKSCFIERLISNNFVNSKEYVNVCLFCIIKLFPEDVEFSDARKLDKILSVAKLKTIRCKCRKGFSPGLDIPLSFKYVTKLKDMHREAIKIRKSEAEEILKKEIPYLRKLLDETPEEAWKKVTKSHPFNIDYRYSDWLIKYKETKKERDNDIIRRISRKKENVFSMLNI